MSKNAIGAIMIRQYLIISVLALLASCSGEDKQPESKEGKVAETNSSQEEKSDTLLEEDKWNVSNPDSLIADYIKYRQQAIQDPSVEISGKVFYQKDDFYILNFTEQWEQYQYDFVLVLNGEVTRASDVPESFNNIQDEIYWFLIDQFHHDYTFYPGNFEEAPQYEVGENTPVLLADRSNYRTTYSGFVRLCLLNGNQLTETQIHAKTEADIGNCEYLDGIAQKFVDGLEKEDIVVEVNQSRNAECENEYFLKYWNVWPNYMRSKDRDYYEPYVKFDEMSDSLYAELETLNLSRLDIIENDTLRVHEQISFEEVYNGHGRVGAKFLLQEIHSRVDYKILSIKKETDAYQLFCLTQNKELYIYTLSRDKHDKQLYRLKLEGYDYALYVSEDGRDRFELEVIEEDEF